MENKRRVLLKEFEIYVEIIGDYNSDLVVIYNHLRGLGSDEIGETHSNVDVEDFIGLELSKLVANGFDIISDTTYL